MYNLVPLFSTRKDKRGRKGFFSTKGKLALMFLKSYSKSSDEKLIERINTNVLPIRYYKHTYTIRKIPAQQQEMFETGKSVPGRIVSIVKDYIRPLSVEKKPNR